MPKKPIYTYNFTLNINVESISQAKAEDLIIKKIKPFDLIKLTYEYDTVVEDNLTEIHLKEMKRRFTRSEYDNANIGWGRDELAICSKIYGIPNKWFCTTFNVKTHQYKHEQGEL